MSSAASFPFIVARLSENHPFESLSIKVLFPIPCGPVRVGMLSYLIPGTKILATAATK